MNHPSPAQLAHTSAAHSKRSSRFRVLLWTLLCFLLVSLTACDGCKRQVREEYFKSLEKIGFEKREMLVKRVDKARDAQEDAQEQFEDALEQFQALVGHTGSDLEAMYGSLKAEYEDAEARAENVRSRIRKVENVAEALFSEWETEIGEMQNPEYKRESRKQLSVTQTKYKKLLTTMKKASQSMEPILAKLKDQVLYLKHNLNAQAFGNLDREAELLQTDVGRLITDMQESIAEADRFIAEMSP